MAQRWAIDMVEAIRGQASLDPESGWRFARVVSESPLSISLHDQTISRNLYKSYRLELEPGDEVLVYQHGISFYVIAKVVPA